MIVITNEILQTQNVRFKIKIYEEKAWSIGYDCIEKVLRSCFKFKMYKQKSYCKTKFLVELQCRMKFKVLLRKQRKAKVFE